MKESALFPSVWLFILLISFLTVQGAEQTMNAHPNLEKEKQIILGKDKEISKTAAEKGVLKAFYPFMTETSILLPENGHPVVGKESCAKLMSGLALKGPGNRIKWEPLLAGISTAGDLAYSHGRFELPPAAGADAKEGTRYGYYGTIWKKETNGNWKVAFSQGLVLVNDLKQKPFDKLLDPENVDPVTREVLATERAFSDYSVTNGRLPAFYRYIDDNGMALGSGGAPKMKKDFAAVIADAEMKKQAGDPGPGESKLEWQALYSYVAASGDLAYNFGSYLYNATDANGRSSMGRGYFMTVWMKQADGPIPWKFILDAGNEVN
jgi:ketosteroid isomerase-like protein